MPWEAGLSGFQAPRNLRETFLSWLEGREPGKIEARDRFDPSTSDASIDDDGNTEIIHLCTSLKNVSNGKSTRLPEEVHNIIMLSYSQILITYHHCQTLVIID